MTIEQQIIAALQLFGVMTIPQIMRALALRHINVTVQEIVAIIKKSNTIKRASGEGEVAYRI